MLAKQVGEKARLACGTLHHGSVDIEPTTICYVCRARVEPTVHGDDSNWALELWSPHIYEPLPQTRVNVRF
eukprot:4461870-Amphidinium_carterae.1